jgi:hypothetical protein
MPFSEVKYHHTLRFPGDDVASLAPTRTALHFIGCDGPDEVDCFVTRAVLELLEGGVLDVAGCLNAFRKHRSAIHDMAARQYAKYGLNPQGNITVTLADV